MVKEKEHFMPLEIGIYSRLPTFGVGSLIIVSLHSYFCVSIMHIKPSP
jgi:hypothetical protein